MTRYRQAVACILIMGALSQVCLIFKTTGPQIKLARHGVQGKNVRVTMVSRGSESRFESDSMKNFSVEQVSREMQSSFESETMRHKNEEQVTPVLLPVAQQLKNATGPKIVFYQLSPGFRQTFKRYVDLRRCKYNDCSFRFVPQYTIFYDYYNVSLDADAVIFQGNKLTQKPPVRRDANQAFVFFDMECPWYLHNDVYKHDSWRSVFNWTMTYRRDSDFPNPYAIPVPGTAPALPTNFSQLFRSKTKDILWFVSHCSTDSMRELYAKALGKHLNIDIYGACSKRPNLCPRSAGKECLRRVVEPYKFYLSFENNFCTDYITEKYYFFLPLNIIPIVRGGGDYSQIVPNGTYINTADFSSPDELAVYLKRLAQSEEEYTRFMREKVRYGGVNRSYQRSFCNLCEKLHHLPENRKVYDNIETWWNKGACHKANDL